MCVATVRDIVSLSTHSNAGYTACCGAAIGCGTFEGINASGSGGLLMLSGCSKYQLWTMISLRSPFGTHFARVMPRQAFPVGGVCSSPHTCMCKLPTPQTCSLVCNVDCRHSPESAATNWYGCNGNGGTRIGGGGGCCCSSSASSRCNIRGALAFKPSAMPSAPIPSPRISKASLRGLLSNRCDNRVGSQCVKSGATARLAPPLCGNGAASMQYTMTIALCEGRM